MPPSRPNPEQDHQNNQVDLAQECQRFAPPKELSQLDSYWQELCQDPSRAGEVLNENIGSFDRHTNQAPKDGELTGRNKVIASLGALLVAAESGNPTAQQLYGAQRTRIQLAGHYIVSYVTDITDAGPNQGSLAWLYTATSAADNPAYTVWRPPAATAAADRIASYRESRKPAKPGEKGHAIVHDSAHVNAIGLGTLKRRYQLQNTGGEDVPYLFMAYHEIARNLGALPRYYNNPDDAVARQHLEDFLSSALRFRQSQRLGDEKKMRKDSDVIEFVFGRDIADMFFYSAIVMKRRGVNIKGYNGNALSSTVRAARSVIQPTVVRPMVTPNRRRRHKPAVAPPMPAIPPAIVEGPLKRLGNHFKTSRHANRPTGQRAPREQPTTYREATAINTARVAAERWATRSFSSKLTAPLGPVLDAAMNALRSGDRDFPWVTFFAALSLRQQHAAKSGLTRNEASFLRNHEAVLAAQTADQLYRTGTFDRISGGRAVPAEYMTAVCQLMRWAGRAQRGEAQSTLRPETLKHLSDAQTEAVRYNNASCYGNRARTLPDRAQAALFELSAVFHPKVWQDPNVSATALIIHNSNIRKALGDTPEQTLPPLAQQRLGLLQERTNYILNNSPNNPNAPGTPGPGEKQPQERPRS